MPTREDAMHRHPSARAVCSKDGCERIGEAVYDHYGIYAGRWCPAHRDEAPGQWPYWNAADCEPLDEEG